ncbi:MAG: RNA methyltransferase [Alphaproteobacteria bacterium]|nr:RNA methyltransferase [Alphaproteobacteria bacterium]
MHIILLETQLAENLGAVARAMGNFGLTSLRLVNPRVSPADPKAIAMAVGADAILSNAPIYSCLSDATADLTSLFGTTAIEREMIKRYYSPRRFAEWSQQQESNHPRIGLLFGPERTGLSNDDLAKCNGVIHIPVCPEFSSLNLGQAVVVIGYEWFCAHSHCHHEDSHLHLGDTSLATHQQVAFFLNALEQKLDTARFWRVAHKKPIMWRTIQNIFQRTDLTEQEVRTLHGIVDALTKQT